MNGRSDVFERALAGAIVGGLVSYLYLTESGRQVRHDAEAWLADFLDAMKQMQSTLSNAQRAVEEGRHSWEAVLQLARPGSARHLDAGAN